MAAVIGPPRTPQPDREAAADLPIQRWAWVSAAKVKPTEPSLDPAMKAFAADKVVRDYGSDAEFKAHAAGKTDYLGNLPGPASKGTWVRFSPTGTNLLGENHTQVTLEEVVRAVGSTSFIYEPLSVDTMAPGSSMKAAYETENKDRFARMGVAGVADKQQFGAESLFPKMGYGLNLLVPILSSGKLDDLKPGAYVGQPAQRYLKIAWGYSKDVGADIAALKAAKKKVPKELKDLQKLQKSLSGQLDGFLTSLVVDAYLGDALDTPAGKKLIPALITFCQRFVSAMLARAATDDALSNTERTDLKAMKKGSNSEKQGVFDKWRNLHFSHAVRDAAKRGVRYAGMGRAHMDYLIAEGIPANSRTYDMTGKDIADYDQLTKNLAASVKP